MTEATINKQPITGNLEEIEAYMKDRVGLGTSFDLGVRKIKVLNRSIHLYYVNGLVDTLYVITYLQEVVNLNDRHDSKFAKDLFLLVKNYINNQSVEIVLNVR